MQARNVLHPELPLNASKNYNATPFIGNTYQIYRSIYHRIALDKGWDNVYSYPPLPSGNMGDVKIDLQID